VDDLFRTGPDAPTIGLLLCESHRSPIVEYTLRSIDKPIGVSSYRVTRELPAPIRAEVPTVEDLQAVVTKLRDEMETLRQGHRMKNKQNASETERSLAAKQREKCHSLWHFWNRSCPREAGRQ